MTPRFLLTSLAFMALGACAHPPGGSSGGAPLALAASPGTAAAPGPAPTLGPAPLAVAGDEAGPTSCARGEHVLACTVWTPSQPLHLMAMAVSGRSIGIGWTTSGNPWVQRSESGPAFFEILDERLEPVHRLVIPGDAVRDVAVAAWRSGWVVATADGTGTEVRHIGADGAIRGPSLRVDGGAPHLAVGARGDVLLVRTSMLGSTAVTRAMLLTGLDEPPRFDVTVIEQPMEMRFGSVVALDDGFLIAQRGNSGVEVVHLDRRGRLGTRHQQVGSSTEYPKLASCGADATMVWADFSGHAQLRWSALDGEGSSSTDHVTLGGTPDYFDPSPGICDRLGSIVLLGGYTGGTGVASHLELVRVDGAGRTGELLPVLGRSQRAYDWRIDELGGDVVVSWIELAGTIGVARLRAPAAGGLSRAR